ncbi:helix-turn-helix transcriptional regulator [Chitinophaga ginsengisegetis]|uniref:helix-turn-helix domain-containing protein n=1 Tax=Chitinophaga ginsengisegetis TaxID=393003 RepID=UPI000DBA2DBB|nr:helix-turn-helix transcriptional regulator [Chitinophaga ginsengisegetis]MDR6571256.1 transcriptional regulator with XRE-family HTH domain [Chitinophaga ginsengisegetis]MDR6650906.1 transcriptional regulator with XRE-family HTH domain [Chitinophaga ginsengisegetis]MDR6657340.1 transcriptional regulator with XRE-family HTH domain [Chitinophaga ginsengisegetis]
MNRFGEEIKHLRVQKNLLQRQVANLLDIDTPMLSKIERGERPAKREQVSALCRVFETKEGDLFSLWLADKIYDLIKNEPTALKALSITKDKLKSHKNK